MWSNEGAREESLSGLLNRLAGQGLIISVTAYVGRAAEINVIPCGSRVTVYRFVWGTPLSNRNRVRCNPVMDSILRLSLESR